MTRDTMRKLLVKQPKPESTFMLYLREGLALLACVLFCLGIIAWAHIAHYLLFSN